MANKYFKNATFWAREFRLPLFFQVLINKNKNTIAFYRDSMVHAYYLDDTEEKLGLAGYKFFSDKNKVTKYKERVKKLFEQIIIITKEYQRIKISEIDDKELEKNFFKVLAFLDRYSRIYLITEAARLERIVEEKNKNLIKILGKLRFELRKEGESVFYILLGTLLKEVYKRSGVKVADLFFYDYDEMQRLFKGKKVKKVIIESRKKGYALISLPNKKVLLIGQEFNKLYREIVWQKEKKKEISGRVAMRGKAGGRVRIILHNKRSIIEEVKKFKKGEILVTEMTRPDTVLACKKASAIITDEGGITSHAAIVSRELKIPCVIGTKIATQVLRDGDLVEVDANKGKVVIVKRK